MNRRVCLSAIVGTAASLAGCSVIPTSDIDTEDLDEEDQIRTPVDETEVTFEGSPSIGTYYEDGRLHLDASGWNHIRSVSVFASGQLVREIDADSVDPGDVSFQLPSVFGAGPSQIDVGDHIVMEAILREGVASDISIEADPSQLVTEVEYNPSLDIELAHPSGRYHFPLGLDSGGLYIEVRNTGGGPILLEEVSLEGTKQSIGSGVQFTNPGKVTGEEEDGILSVTNAPSMVSDDGFYLEPDAVAVFFGPQTFTESESRVPDSLGSEGGDFSQEFAVTAETPTRTAQTNAEVVFQGSLTPYSESSSKLAFEDYEITQTHTFWD